MIAPSLSSEPTEAGEQTLMPGVAPVRLGDRLALLAAAPMMPRKAPRPADFGLFDLAARDQLELFGPARPVEQPADPRSTL